MLEGYLRYVDFMVERFKDKVACYEVGNEWGGRRDVYAQGAHRIKERDPPGQDFCVDRLSHFSAMLSRWMSECSSEEMALLMPDAVGSHPTTRVDAGLTLDDLQTFYWQENRSAIQAARALGHRGVFIASEVYSWSLYPPGPFEIDERRPSISKTYAVTPEAPAFCGESEIVRAKYLAQNFVGHAASGMMAFQANTYFVSCPVGQSLFGVPVPSQVINPIQPDAGYYVFRTICTVMDGWRSAEFPVECRSQRELHTFTFRRGARERMVAIWIPGSTDDQGPASATDILLPRMTVRQVWGIDLLNGVEQEMPFGQRGNQVVRPGIIVRDYPLLLRLTTEHATAGVGLNIS